MKAILSIVVLAIVCGVLPIVSSLSHSKSPLVRLSYQDLDDSSSDQDGDEVGEHKEYNNYEYEYDDNDDDENDDDENDDDESDDDDNDDDESDDDDNDDDESDDDDNDDDENDDDEDDENDDDESDDDENNDDDDENDDDESDENDDDEDDDYENDDSSENDENDDYETDDSENDENDDSENDDYESYDSESDDFENNENSKSDDSEKDDSKSDDSENDENDDSESYESDEDLKQADPTFRIDYLLYTRKNNQSGELLRPDDLGELLINGSAHKGTIFIFHGFTSNGYADWVQDMKDELLLFDNFNVIVVDWREGAEGPRYLQAVRNTRIVGQRTANLIKAMENQKGVGANKTHLIGHSLGAHCAGFTGKRIQELIGQRLSRISGLDPAGPLLQRFTPEERLDKNDAYFVDIIHTNDGKLGWKKNSPLGHVDFYPNGGSKQPGCPGGITDSCAHSRVTELYIYSIRRCPFLTRPGAAVCPEGPDTGLQMGYNASLSLIGNASVTYCLETTGAAPYCDKLICAAGPTVFLADPFKPDRAARKLKKAVVRFGTAEAAIINVVTQHTYEQRKEIETRYKKNYDRDLRRDLRFDLIGNLEYTVLALFDSPRVFDAKEIRRSVQGAGTDEATLIEILSSRSNAEIVEIKQQYGSLFSRNMENDIRADTSRDFEDLLISLSAAKRDDGPADPVQARLDAIALHEAGDKMWGTDEAVFTGILSSRSFAQLKEIFRQYQSIAGRTLTQSIERETSGDLEDGYLAIVQLATNTPAFFAEKLYRSMRGTGTDNKALIRLVVSRSEIDMEFIKEEFQRMYSRSLASAIKGCTSGNFEKLLLALIKGQKCKLKVV